ncbi:MAG: MBL fold metallo-hydrolase [Chloroflexi bacterium]|nr:MBL fold metallo-hydrolase [Chloroflexota bacterium]
MEITFLGAARSVTGSMHLLSINDKRILLDCGLYQGHRQEAFERNRTLPFDASTIDVLVLSHAHIDHSGNIPNLVKSGFNGPIYATSATRDLCAIMLRDSAHIMESDVEYLNEQREKQGLPALEPTYTTADAQRALKQFHSLEYGSQFTIAPGVDLTFRDAGHILGSALSVLDIQESGSRHRLMFSGDLGRRNMLILRDPEVVRDVTHLIIESTYGGRLHGTPEEAELELGRVVNETVSRKGKLIIPAFSVGRTQEIIYGLHRLALDNKIPHLPVYVDSPLSVNATEIFRLHPEAYDSETDRFVLEYSDPFSFDSLHYVRRAEDSKAINRSRKPAIIISASGMCEGGRILHHLINNIGNSRNTILFVGYQAEDTLGARIKAGEKRVPILGNVFKVRANIEAIDAFSAHADQNEILDYVQQINGSLKQVFIVHGETEASLALQQGLAERGISQTLVPERGQSVTI